MDKTTIVVSAVGYILGMAVFVKTAIVCGWLDDVTLDKYYSSARKITPPEIQTLAIWLSLIWPLSFIYGLLRSVSDSALLRKNEIESERERHQEEIDRAKKEAGLS